MEPIKRKIHWVDQLKVIGIAAVILGHMNSPLSRFIYSWHMPLFFMIAGFFINCKANLQSFCLNNFKRLMIPYFVFAYIGLIAEVVKRSLLHRVNVNVYLSVKAIMFNMNMNSLSDQYGFVLWFMPALLIARIIVFTLLKKVHSVFLQWAVIIFFFSFSFFSLLPYGLTNGMNAALFVFIGFYTYKYINNFKLARLIVLVFCISFIAVSMGIPGLNMANIYYEMPIINVLWSICFVTILSLILQKTQAPRSFERIISFCAAESLFIFVTHPYSNNIAYILNNKLLSGCWITQFIISISILWLLILFKSKIKRLFKYV